MKKYYFRILFSVFLMFFVIVPVYADADSNIPEEAVITSKYTYESPELGTIIFDSQSDLDVYMESLNIQKNTKITLLSCFPGDLYYPTCVPPTGGGTTTTNLVKKNVSIFKKFIKYSPHTPSWQKASSYSNTSTKKFGVSFRYEADGWSFAVNFDISGGTSATLPADPTKYSRLAGSASFLYDKYEVINRDSKGNITSRAKFSSNIRITETFIDVWYR